MDIFGKLCTIGRMFTLAAEKRDTSVDIKELRAGGKIPGVFYGAKTKSTPISISKIDFKKIWKEAGESSVITLHALGEEVDVLIHDVALDPVTDEPIHFDFYAIDKNKKVTVSVPLVFSGESLAVKNLGGTLVKVFYELEVEGLPKDLPHDVSVDLSLLTELDSHISVGDLKLPAGVVATAEPEETVASIAEQKEEEIAPPEIDLASIEVEKKGKKEEAEEAPSEKA